MVSEKVNLIFLSLRNLKEVNFGLIQKTRPRQSVPNSWRKMLTLNWKKRGKGEKQEEKRRNGETGK